VSKVNSSKGKQAEELALTAAAQAIMDAEGWRNGSFSAETTALLWDTAKRDAAAAVKAYCEYADAKPDLVSAVENTFNPFAFEDACDADD
jgi:hypothetical protein